MARSKTVRLIAWDAALVPAPGEEVCCTVAGPLSIGNKEPAGHKFHLAVLKQSGVLSEWHTRAGACCRAPCFYFGYIACAICRSISIYKPL